MQMKLVSAIAMGAAVAEAVWAGDTAQSEQATVTVCMSQRGNASVFRAQAVASQIFARIGVRIDWQNCPIQDDPETGLDSNTR